MRYELAIVIINYRTPAMLLDCLESLLKEVQDNWTVVVVDNASNDNSLQIINDWLAKHPEKPQIKLIASPVNSGFSGGNNTGIKAVSADNYLLLNSDTLVRPNAITTLLTTLKSDNGIGIVSPRLEWPDAKAQESCFKYHTPVSEFLSAAKTGILSKLFARYIVPQPVSDQPKSYEWVSFACVLVRGETFERIGLMDDRYFMYYEDVEFCHRAQKDGWQIRYEPSAHVVHLRGGSSPVKAQAKLRKRLPRYYYESRTRYFYQLYGRAGLFMANFLWTAGWLISIARQFTSKSYQPDISEKQWQDIWTNFLQPEKPYQHPDHYGK